MLPRRLTAAICALLALPSASCRSDASNSCMIGPANCALLRQQARENEMWKQDGWSRACQDELSGYPLLKAEAQPSLLGGSWPRGRRWLDESSRACADGEPESCTIVAKAYAWGCRVTPNRSYGRTLFRWSCDAGSLDACYSLDRFSDEPDDSRFFNARIQRLLAESCERADAKSCRDLAQLTWNGYRDTPRSEQRTLELLRAPCENRDPDACRDLAFFYSLSELDEGRREAASIHESWCTPEHFHLRWPCDEVVERAQRFEAAGQHAAAARSFDIACKAGMHSVCRASEPDAGTPE